MNEFSREIFQDKVLYQQRSKDGKSNKYYEHGPFLGYVLLPVEEKNSKNYPLIIEAAIDQNLMDLAGVVDNLMRTRGSLMKLNDFATDVKNAGAQSVQLQSVRSNFDAIAYVQDEGDVNNNNFILGVQEKISGDSTTNVDSKKARDILQSRNVLKIYLSSQPDLFKAIQPNVVYLNFEDNKNGNFINRVVETYSNLTYSAKEECFIDNKEILSTIKHFISQYQNSVVV